jgi:hypothetical protein
MILPYYNKHMMGYKMKNFIAIAAMIGASYISLNNDYMSEKQYKATLVDKFQASTSKSAIFYGVFKLDDGTTFDLTLSPSDFRLLDLNHEYQYSLRPFDIKQSPTQNILYFLSPIIILATSVVMIFSIIFCGGKQ